MKRQETDRLRIAIQKEGRLSEWSVDLLRQMGLRFDTYKRLLISPCRNHAVDILFLRDDDIPEYVQDGVVDLGIVGDNVVSEKEAKVNRLRPLGFGNCSLQIAVPENSAVKEVKSLSGRRIATTYPKTLAGYLARQRVAAEIVSITGAVEITPSLDVADAICDLVSTGTTLTTHNLVSIATVMTSEAALIGNSRTCGGEGGTHTALPGGGATRALITDVRIDGLLLRLDGVLNARATKYVMLNAPLAAVEQIREIMSGRKSPTIVPLADSAMVAVHAVVTEDEFWDKMTQLKTLGASDILVMNIEKMIV